MQVRSQPVFICFKIKLYEDWAGTILESKGMHVIFQKKSKKGVRNVKKGQNILKIWVKIYKI